ncbi:hypothetical protein FEM48_Zijuj01G0235100 [Ziziphus jujuba var. spinosa]|uniref:Cytochrome b561 and DOMON domain-containing protein n=1 Tax=Ziziphus jujuba var. spinosa TaxID=714518 RepID=A0A978W471_ZIZJJ|nr:hypothetical protein FEM48_Zijuj01G0235100 [Ziziphus jujuba var. spinosa]
MAMRKLTMMVIFVSILLGDLLGPTAAAEPCRGYKFSDGKSFVACKDLPVLNSTLHWSYYPSSGTVDIAFRQTATTTSTWAAWAINPTSHGMVGAQALVAFQQSDGTMVAYSSPIQSYATLLRKGELSFPVFNISAASSNINSFFEITIFATIQLPGNSTLVNHLWQQGPLLQGDVLGMHPLTGDHVKSFGSLDFASGKIETSSGGGDFSKKATIKKVHGIINGISWGLLMPIGAMVARYVKVFEVANPAWFYIHVTCQCSAYLIGVAGWGTGVWLGAKSSGIQYKAHKCIGITLFCLATLQVLVGRFLRPKKDHKYRIFWNMFHYAVGYGTIVLSIINVYKGLHILQPGKAWRDAYTFTLASLGCIAAVMEVFTWILVYKKNKLAKVQTVEEENKVETDEEANKAETVEESIPTSSGEV